MKEYAYCPLCVDYFENIRKHHFDNHPKKIRDVKYDADGKLVDWELLQLNHNYKFTVIKK